MSVAKILTEQWGVAAVVTCLAVAAIVLVVRYWQFLNDNAGGVTALATVVLAAATLLYVVLLFDQLRRQREEADTTSRARAVAVSLELRQATVILMAHGDEPRVLRDSAYPYAIFDLPRFCDRLQTLEAVLAAYRAIERSNAACHSTAVALDKKIAAWHECKKAVIDAQDAMDGDAKLYRTCLSFVKGLQRAAPAAQKDESQK